MLNQWWEAHQLALPVCWFAGVPPAARHLAAVSRTLHRVISESWDDLTRLFPRRLYVVGGIDAGYKTLRTVERYDPLLGAWESLPALETPCAAAAASAAGGRLYIFGGEAGGRALRDARRYDPWTREWENLPPMAVGRIRAAAVACSSSGHIYLIGGLDGTKPMRTVERYDPRTRGWQTLASMHRPRYACAATAECTGAISVFGGELTELGTRSSSEHYDASTDSWTLLPPVRSPCVGSTVALAGGAAFAVGGLGLNGQAQATTECVVLPLEGSLDDSTPQWTLLPAMPTPRQLATVTNFRGGVVAIGGKDVTFEAVAHVEYFDPEAFAWAALPSLPTARIRCAAVTGYL